MKQASDDAIRVHQDAALIGFTVMELAGFVGWVALWQWRRRGAASRGLVPVATVLLLVSLAVMGRAANLGGEIRHPEIRADGVAAPGGDPKRFMTYAIGQVAVYSTWVWPAAEAVHFLGLVALVRRADRREPADTRDDEADPVCGRASSAALGHAGVRRESDHRHVLLRRTARAVHRKRSVLLEDRVSHDCRRELSVSDGIREGVGASRRRHRRGTGSSQAWGTNRWPSCRSCRGSGCCTQAACSRSWASPSEAGMIALYVTASVAVTS